MLRWGAVFWGQLLLGTVQFSAYNGAHSAAKSLPLCHYNCLDRNPTKSVTFPQYPSWKTWVFGNASRCPSQRQKYTEIAEMTCSLDVLRGRSFHSLEQQTTDFISTLNGRLTRINYFGFPLPSSPTSAESIYSEEKENQIVLWGKKKQQHLIILT